MAYDGRPCSPNTRRERPSVNSGSSSPLRTRLRLDPAQKRSLQHRQEVVRLKRGHGTSRRRRRSTPCTLRRYRSHASGGTTPMPSTKASTTEHRTTRQTQSAAASRRVPTSAPSRPTTPKYFRRRAPYQRPSPTRARRGSGHRSSPRSTHRVPASAWLPRSSRGKCTSASSRQTSDCWAS